MNLLSLKKNTIGIKNRFSGRNGKWGFWVEPTMGIYLFDWNEDLWSVRDEIEKNLTFINNL